MTTQEAVSSIIKKTPFLEEALRDGLINVSALARQLQEEIEIESGKCAKQGAIMMAINRLSPSNILEVRKSIEKITFTINDFTLRSNLCGFTFKNSFSLLKSLGNFMEEIDDRADSFFTVTQGVFETSFIINRKLGYAIQHFFKQEKVVCQTDDLASITIKLPKMNVEISGIYYLILKQLAWSGITVYELISTTHEMTIFVKENKIKETFELLMDMKKK